MKVSGMTRLNTAEHKFILIVVFLNFNLLLLLLLVGSNRGGLTIRFLTLPAGPIWKTLKARSQLATQGTQLDRCAPIVMYADLICECDNNTTSTTQQ